MASPDFAEETEVVEKPANEQPASNVGIQQWDEDIVSAYGRIIGALPKLASGALGLVIIAYLVGWLRAESYYSAFGARWVTRELTPIELLSFSLWPLVFLVIGLVLTMTDIAERLIGKSLRQVESFLLGLVIFSQTIAMGLSWSGYKIMAAYFALASLFNSSSLLMLTFGKIVLGLHSNRFKWHSSLVWILFWACLSYGANCMILGSIEGDRDNDPAHSELPAVMLRDTVVGDWRLLRSSDQTMYVANIADSTNHPPVSVLGADQVTAIMRRPTRQGNK